MIRNYQASDKEQIIHLLQLNTPQYFAPSEEKDLIQYLEKHVEWYYVLELEGEIVGCGGINFSENSTKASISWDIFAPKHQGKGLGTLLMQHRLEKLKQLTQIKSIFVRTSQHACLFYEKQGFSLKEIIKNYWAEGFDLYFMEYPPIFLR